MAKKKILTPSQQERTKLVNKDIGKYMALEVLKESEGGKLITFYLKRDILTCLDKISAKYKNANHGELIALCAEMSEKLSVFRTIFRSSKNMKLAKDELQSILDESEDFEE